MNDDERAFLRKLLEQPNSDLTRLVYADWLDEQQTPDAVAKAEFLRLIADPEFAGLTDRAKELSRELDPQWLAAVAKLPIENCPATAPPPLVTDFGVGLAFAFECPKRWEELTPTEENGVRFCGACQKTVHYCRDRDDLRLNANLGNCVAVELGVPRRPGDLEPEYIETVTMGLVEFEEYIQPEAEQEAERIRQRILEESRPTGRRRRRRRREQQEE